MYVGFGTQYQYSTVLGQWPTIISLNVYFCKDFQVPSAQSEVFRQSKTQTLH